MTNQVKRMLSLGVTALMFCSPMLTAAQKKQAWQDELVKAKQTMSSKLKAENMPLRTALVRGGETAKPLSVNVGNFDELVLTTNEGPDGNGSDHSVWANARLTTKTGQTVWLDELKPTYEHAGWGNVVKNADMSGNRISIAGKKYDKGIFIHATGVLVYKLDKKFKTFETEVGINDSGKGSVIFDIQNTTANAVINTLSPQGKEQLSKITSLARVSQQDFLSSTDLSVETKAARALIGNLKDKKHYENRVNEILKSGNVAQQNREMLVLIDELATIDNVQEQLAWLNLDALKAAHKDMSQVVSYPKAKNAEKLQFIEQNIGKVQSGLYTGNKEMIALANKIMDYKRAILLDNPQLDIDKILVGRYRLGRDARKAMAPSLGTQSNNWSSQPSARRNGFDAEIALLSNLRGDIQSTTVFKPENGSSVADLQLHWDANRVMFTMTNNNKRWQVYEVGMDGKGLKQVIESPEEDLEFCDANFLPDGRVIATSTIGYHGVPCVNGWDAVCNLVLYNPTDKNLRRLTFDQDGNWNPVVMNNGRVMYTRWEYTDLTHYFSRFVMHMNPDGTENRALYGSGSFWPNSTFDMKPLPGTGTKFVGIISGHHGVARSGRMMIFDPAKSRKEEKGVVQEIPFKDREIIPEVKDGLVDGVWPQFIKPYPLNEKYFLVAGKLTPNSLWGIYLTDVYDNLTLLAEFEGEGLIAPIPVRKTETPPVIPDRVKLNDKEATIFIQDIYEGEGLPGVPRGTVKNLRIFAYEFAYNYSPSDHYAHGIQAGWDIKRLLGTVPVEKDGSAIFKVPANVPISIQPLDEEGRAVQWMRSWVTSMPGEIVSCIGCHEDQNKIPMPKRVIASTIEPHAIIAPEGGSRAVTFNNEVQPVLDRNCISCHNDKMPSLNFVKREEVGETDWAGFKRNFSLSYLAFHPYVYRQGPEAEMYVLKPYEYHVSNSDVIRLLEKGHHGVKLSDKEWQSLYTWIDLNAPYGGTFEEIQKFNNQDQYARRIALADKYNNAGIDWRKELVDYANYMESKPAEAAPVREAVKTPKYKAVAQKGWPFSNTEAKQMQAALSESERIVEIAPNVRMKFVRVPAGKFVMGNNIGERDHAPEYKANVDKAFWMGQMEVTNEQYCALVPEHNSRIIGQFWKDHTTAGYPANKPQQPVIRVSWEEALQYCEMLSEKTGLKITLPTEEQWEWAAKAGSDTEFWYGDNNADFGKYGNMADASLSKMAVSGVNPQPMSKNDPWFKYYDYIPKIAAVNDGEMIVCEVGQYEANPWGLFDMNGNVAEWTRGDYVSYPITAKAKKIEDKKVARGGSWMDRPKFANSNVRKAFLPWQKVYNVGFRVIIEE
ncbi:MAG: SUMF1/EgtB/PvdO family nonheme iron enzyme [Marinifilaceae bacterium]